LRIARMRRNHLDLRRSAVVHNLHVIVRMPDEQEWEEMIAA
jgi:hypothetical protein